VLRDPAVVRVDAQAPFNRFDGRFGSLITGEGWSRPLRVDDTLSAGFAQEAVALESEVMVPALTGDSFDFVLRCRPHESVRGQRLRVTLVEAERTVGESELSGGWQTLRFQLPEPTEAGARRLRFRFREPDSEQLEASRRRHERRHWATCSLLAIVPREIEEPLALVQTLAGVDLAAPRIELPPLAGLAVPVPGRSTIRISPEFVRVSGLCRLEAALWERGRRQVGQELDADGVELKNAGQAPAELRISTTGERGGLCRDDSVELGLPPVWLHVRVVPTQVGANPPNLVVYLVDTLRADAVRGTELDGFKAPYLRAFARDAVDFRSAWSSSSWTLPAVTTLLTGLDPRRHGVMRWDSRLAEDGPPTLAARLATAGYQTAAISQSWLAGRDFGLDRGFEHFVLNDQFNGLELRSQEARRILRHFLLEVFRPDRPFFLYVHTVDPHGPYSPPPGPYLRYAEAVTGSQFGLQVRTKDLQALTDPAQPADIAKVRALYQGEVLFADEQFGRLLELLRSTGFYDASAIGFVSDHGEEFDEHGDFGHGATLFEEVLQVPLLLKLPGNREGGREIASRVSLLDLPATMLALAGLEGVDGERAFDLRALMDQTARRDGTYADLIPIGDGQRDDRWLSAAAREARKCILETDRTGKPRTGVSPFLDLVVEPSAGVEAPTDPLDADSQRCRKLLLEYRRLRPLVESVQHRSPSDEDLARLRAVGYLK
jgi:arylsulfatase A-like enzyme